MPWQSTKTYGHELGISCAFRQWRATHSHCQYLHGYALSFKFVFEAETLDDRRWVQDFGNLKELKSLLVEKFDHRTVVAHDDPLLSKFFEMEEQGMLQMIIMEDVGCEKFAEYAHRQASLIIERQHPDRRVRVVSCEVAEHGSNSAIYIPTKQNSSQD